MNLPKAFNEYSNNMLDNSGLVGTIFMDLSKVYDCLPHDFLIVKCKAYGLDKPSLNLINDYLSFEIKVQKLALHIVTWLMLLAVFSRDLF